MKLKIDFNKDFCIAQSFYLISQGPLNGSFYIYVEYF